MKLTNILLIALGLYVLGRNKINEWANRINVSVRGLKVNFERGQLQLIPSIEIANPTPAPIAARSTITVIKYNGKEVAKSTDYTPLNIPANAVATYQPKVVVRGLGTITAIQTMINDSTVGTWTYSGTIYTSGGAIPWSYTDNTTGTTTNGSGIA